MVSSAFRKRLMKSPAAGVRDALLGAAPGRASEELLFPLFAEYVLNEHGREIKIYRCGWTVLLVHLGGNTAKALLHMR